MSSMESEGHLIHASYHDLQALGKMLETEVVVRVREVDKDLVKESAEAAKSKFKDNFPGIAVPTLVIDTKSYLAPPPSGKNEEESDSW